MKLLILTALIAAVASSPLTQSKSWPWQVGKDYHYNVNTFTWTKYEDSNSNGNAFKAEFIIRVLAPGQLLAKLSQPLYAQIKSEEITYNVAPSDLKYESVKITDEPIEILVVGGRVKSFKVPVGLSVAHENLLKGLISALQVDLSTFGHVDDFPNSFDKESFQGLFKKIETDVTGECETLYTVSPVSAEWRRELPNFASEEDPIEIVKSKNYDSCKKRATFFYGVPEGSIWNGIAYENEQKQFIKHTSESRTLAGKQGTIYQTDVISSVYVSPLLFGKQKAEVYSYVKAALSSVKETTGEEWKKPEEVREISSLIFSMSESMFRPKFTDKTVANAQKLLQDMTPLLQNPDQLSKGDFLAKFNILVRLIISLDSEQLNLLTSSVEIARDSKNSAKNGMWIIYRDAVAQAGTDNAFEQIKSWILNKKVQGEEAGELLSGIGATLMPSEKVIAEVFDFATNPEVMGQQTVNVSALLAATKLSRFNEANLYVVDTIIPRLARELKQAVKNADSNKAQVYIRALGNLVKPEVLEVFAPYLDGTVAVSKYLRFQMVASLKALANSKNEYARAVLYSILRNTAEPYEVRVVAALNIFMAFPTAEMMQVMAHMTNDDPSTQVRAVLANGINFAAGLKDPRFAELAKTAQSVQTIVSKEKFGYRISTDSIIDKYTTDDDIAYFRELSYVGSEDNYFPVYHRAALRTRSTGWTEEDQITMSVTGVQQLLDYITQMIHKPDNSKVDFKFSAKDIVQKLNIKREPQDKLEGSLFLENLNQQKLITFNEADLDAFIASAVTNVQQMLKGVDVQYTKVLNQKQTYVIFPLAAGVPFFFEYAEPLIISFNGQVKVNVDSSAKELAGSLNKNLNIVFARNLAGNVGFLDTLSDVYTTVGVINKIQFHIPLNLNTVVAPGQIKLNFVLPEQDATFIHLSVWPYSTLQKIDSMLTVAENPTTKFVERAAKTVTTDLKLDQAPGVSFTLKGYSYSSDFKNINKLFKSDIVSNIATIMYQKDVALTQFDLKYFAKETKNKDITFDLFYKTLFNQKVSGEFGPAAIFEDVSAKARREEIVKRAAKGIESAEVQLYDLSTVFDGEHKVEFVFTAAIAESFVDNKSQGVFLINALKQLNFVYKQVKPKIVPLNFEQALKNKIEVSYEADLKIGSSENYHIQGKGVRSEKYTELLSKDPLAKQCLEETSEGNTYQKDCYKLIMKAHAPDYFKFNVTLEDLGNVFLDMSYGTYELFKQFYSWEQEVDTLKKTNAGVMELEVQAFYYDNYVNYELTSQFGVIAFKNVKGLGYYPYAMAYYAPTTDWERAYNYYYGYQYMPACAVDSSKVQTFSGRSYDYSLSSSWHVVMVDESNEFKWTDLVILARRPSENQEEVYVSYKTEGGKYVELDIKPENFDVKTNGKDVTDGNLAIYWDEDKEVPLLQIYTLADGVKVFNINNGAIRLVYDSQRLVVFTDEHRKTTRGLCGQDSTQIRDDYMTPYGLVDLPEHYGASFSLEGEGSDPKTVELKKEAKLKAYQPVTKYTNILRSDDEWNKAKNESH
ncbi:unnamed protein product [Spodoptera exigua]|nr:unnamed protein product [Spodoptera exigua]